MKQTAVTKTIEVCMYGAGQIVGEIDALLKDNCHFTVTQCSQDSEVYSINY
jgi:CRP-like cAMP-binding protein